MGSEPCLILEEAQGIRGLIGSDHLDVSRLRIARMIAVKEFAQSIDDGWQFLQREQDKGIHG